jgi:paired amphipathic helix protein Sin3a
LDQVKLKFKDQPKVYEQFLDIMKDFKSQVIDTPGVIARVSELFKGHDNLILGFNTFLPPGYKIEMNHFKPGGATAAATSTSTTGEVKNRQQQDKQLQQQDTGKNRIDFDQAISYVTKIKTRFNDQPNTYKAFLDILHTYQKEQTTIRKVYDQVAVLFKDHPDLLEEFTHFLPETPATADSLSRQKALKSKKDQLAKKKKMKSRKLTAEEEYEADDYENRKEFAQANVNKYGPSYRILPKNYPQPKCSGRTELCDEVLNDELVSVPAGSEESTVHRKSMFDEIVFQCEDDRTELDVVIEQNLSTIQFLEPLAERLEKDPNAKFKLDQLRDIHRASIARIYAEKANEVLEGMRKNPAAAIPVILARLRQKDEEWKQARKGLNKFWRDIYEKNYQKAMEEQCSIFKQLDKKALNPKNILIDMEERHAYNKELLLEMSDEQIHHIIYALLEHVGELSEEDMKKAVVFWKDVIIPLFNLKPLPGITLNTIATAEENVKQGKSEDLPLHYLSKIILEKQQETNASKEQPFQPTIEMPLGKKASKLVLYGNVPMLLFFRYYVFAYERLKKAKSLAHKRMSNLQKPSVTADIIRQHETLLNTGGIVIMDNNKNNAIASEVPPTDDYFNLFLRVLNQYFSDNIDTGVYEDECKKLLGYQCWSILTFDKLFANLQKQIQNINADETSTDLVNAFKYEYQRVNNFLDNSYFMQAHKILGNTPCYSFDYHLKKQVLKIDIVEPPELDPEKVSAEEKCLEYVQQCLSTTNFDLQKTNRIFLARNKKLLDKDSKAMDNLLFINGLECKVCMATYKLFYVEDTTDFMYRKKSSKRGDMGDKLKQKKREQLQKFLNKRQPEMIKEAEEKERLEREQEEQAKLAVSEDKTKMDTSEDTATSNQDNAAASNSNQNT